jgi:hypothetical protein
MLSIRPSKTVHRERFEPESRRDLRMRAHRPFGQLHHCETSAWNVIFVEGYPRCPVNEYDDNPINGRHLTSAVDVHDLRTAILDSVSYTSRIVRK